MVIKQEVVAVTPEKAKTLLNTVKDNRTISHLTVESYASDMASGKWYDNGVPIIITDEGTLIDGQHRLSAIIKSGVTLLLEIKTVDRASANGYDLNRIRTVKDIMHLDGIENGAIVNNTAIGAIRGLFYSRGNQKPSKIVQIEECRRHEEGLSLIWQHMKGAGSGIKKAGIWMAFLSAFECGYPVDLLIDAMVVYATGIQKSNRDIVLIRAREKLITTKDHGDRAKDEQCRLTMNSLWHYERGSNPDKLYLVTDYRYPLARVKGMK